MMDRPGIHAWAGGQTPPASFMKTLIHSDQQESLLPGSMIYKGFRALRFAGELLPTFPYFFISKARVRIR